MSFVCSYWLIRSFFYTERVKTVLISQVRVKQIIYSVIFAFLMFGCASPPAPIVQLNPANHQISLKQQQNWQINGKIGFKGPEKKQSANLRWLQQQDHYQLNLTTVIGTSLLSLKGHSDTVTLVADDQVYQDTDASRLIWRVTGWQMPVEQLRFWIKGQHQKLDKVLLSEQGWVSQLTPNCKNCADWLITYDSYKLVDSTWLPHKVILKNQKNNSQLLVRIDEWTL